MCGYVLNGHILYGYDNIIGISAKLNDWKGAKC